MAADRAARRAPAAAMASAPSPAPRRGVHWVVAELDARGEIDGHAALCLRHAIREARSSALELVLVDLRDLTAIGPAGLELFSAHYADCRAHGLALGLLISGRERHRALAKAFILAGLGDTLRYSDEPPLPAVRDRVGLRLPAPVARARRLVPAAVRLTPRRKHRSRVA